MCFFLVLYDFTVFVVLNDVCMFVFLNYLVTMFVSFPIYIKVLHFCLFPGCEFCFVLLVFCFLRCLYVG
jgi:hypothetical protein